MSRPVSRTVLSAILETIHDGVLAVDGRGRVLAVNERFHELWQVPADLLAKGDAWAALAHVLVQLQDPDDFSEFVFRLASCGEAGQHVVCFKDWRIYECISRPLAGEVDGRLWVFRDITHQKQMEADLLSQILRDPLTGLGNRALLQETMAAAIANRQQQGFALCYIDIDSFKPVNDEYGHEVGDHLLVEMGHRFRQALRAGDTLVRMGGDEFVALLPVVADYEAAQPVVARLLAAARTPCTLAEGLVATVSVSIGLALFPQQGNTAQSLIRAADKAMYAAKQAGKDRHAEASA